MEFTPGVNDNTPKSLQEKVFEEVNMTALEKRTQYLVDLKKASTFPELSAAVETYAVSDMDETNPKLVVIDFFNNQESGFNEMIGGEDLHAVVSGMVRVVTENLTGMNEIRGAVFDTMLAERIYEIQNPASELHNPDTLPPLPPTENRFD